MMVGVLLAAGCGTRFGAHKLLHPLPALRGEGASPRGANHLADGATIAEQAAHNLITALPRSVAVVRPGDLALRDLLTGLGLCVVECVKSTQGMGASIACGVLATPDADGWVIALADMPWIRPQTIYTVAHQLRTGAGIVAPQYQGKRGHPVGFAAKFKMRLSALNLDTGARDVIEAEREHLTLSITHDAGVLLDVDVPADAQQGFQFHINGH